MIFPNTTGIKVLKATTPLTTSYVVATVMSAGPQGEHNALGLLVTYTKGDETSIDIKVESTNDPTDTASGSVNWYQQVTQNTSGGATTLAPANYSMTSASAATVQNFTIIISPVKGTMYRISVKCTSGSSVGTYSLNAILGWV